MMQARREARACLGSPRMMGLMSARLMEALWARLVLGDRDPLASVP